MEVEAFLAGDGTLRRSLLNRVRSLGLADSVRLPGSLSAPQLANEMERSHVFLLSSRWEGIPRIVLEALACGVPVVSTRSGDVSRMLAPETGVVVGVRAPRELADAVERMLRMAPEPDQIAASVAGLRASVVVPALLDEIEGAAAERWMP